LLEGGVCRRDTDNLLYYSEEILIFMVKLLKDVEQFFLQNWRTSWAWIL